MEEREIDCAVETRYVTVSRGGGATTIVGEDSPQAGARAPRGAGGGCVGRVRLENGGGGRPPGAVLGRLLSAVWSLHFLSGRPPVARAGGTAVASLFGGGG